MFVGVLLASEHDGIPVCFIWRGAFTPWPRQLRLGLACAMFETVHPCCYVVVVGVVLKALEHVLTSFPRHEPRFFSPDYEDGRPVLTEAGRQAVQDEINRVLVA